MSSLTTTKRIMGALIDLNGTIHVGKNEIPGSINALKRLREAGVKVHFLSNTSKSSKTTLVNSLINMGFELKDEEVTTALTVCKSMCLQQNLRPFLFLTEDALQEFSDFNTEDPNAVIFGLAPSEFHYEKLNNAFHLINNGCEFIAINKAKYYATKEKNNGTDLAVGAFVTGLEYSTGKIAKTVGKPSALFFQEGLIQIQGVAGETVMIGDAVGDDVDAAMELGMKGIVVKTGKYKENDETKMKNSPTAVCKDFLDAVDFIIRHNNEMEEN